MNTETAEKYILDTSDLGLHEVEKSSQQHHDDSDVDHDVDDSTHQHPLSCGSGRGHDGQEDACLDGDLPFNSLGDKSLVEKGYHSTAG